jgi:predicted enzyme related to lactoylglutathione lyase
VNGVSVRYFVNDVDQAIEFYTKMLDFKLDFKPLPEYAMVSKGEFKLHLTRPDHMTKQQGPTNPDSAATPGGWNRLWIQVDDLDSKVETLKKAGCKFRGEMIKGGWGKMILVMDPSGNLIELVGPP